MRLRTLATLSFALVAGCFSPDNPDCAFTCGSFNNFDCPTDYSCNRGDTSVCDSLHTCYCYRKDFTGVCPFPQPDLSGAGMVDAAIPSDSATAADARAPDGSPAGDLPSRGDGGAPDLGMPDISLPLDLASSPDLAANSDMASSPDLAVKSDLAAAPDLAANSDLASSPDLAVSLDLTTASDLAPASDLKASTDASADLSAPPDLANGG